MLISSQLASRMNKAEKGAEERKGMYVQGRKEDTESTGLISLQKMLERKKILLRSAALPYNHFSTSRTPVYMLSVAEADLFVHAVYPSTSSRFRLAGSWNLRWKILQYPS